MTKPCVCTVHHKQTQANFTCDHTLNTRMDCHKQNSNDKRDYNEYAAKR